MNRLRAVLGRARSERGSLSAELVLLAPVLLLFVLFAIAGGRIGLAQISVESAANAAARDVSLSRTEASAQSNATSSATTAVSAAGLNCSPLEVAIDSSGLNAPIGDIGTVRATVSCTVSLSDLALPGLPGSRVITSSATSPVDPYRERQ